MTNLFISEIKTNSSIKELMINKGLKATKTTKQDGKNTIVELFIGAFRVSKMLIGERGAIRVQVNSGMVELMTYLHKA